MWTSSKCCQWKEYGSNRTSCHNQAKNRSMQFDFNFITTFFMSYILKLLSNLYCKKYRAVYEIELLIVIRTGDKTQLLGLIKYPHWKHLKICEVSLGNEQILCIYEPYILYYVWGSSSEVWIPSKFNIGHQSILFPRPQKMKKLKLLHEKSRIQL